MASPRRVRIDAQGRLVLPQDVRDELVEVPGELILERTVDGVLLRPLRGGSRIGVGDDGLPVLEIEGTVRNEDVLDAIDRERQGR